MLNQEKITLNLNAVDLAKVDYLAEQGFYSSRSDFIRTAIRNQLREHDAVVSDAALTELIGKQKSRDNVKAVGCIGVYYLDREKLVDCIEQNRKIKLFVVGALVLAKDVSQALLEQVVESVKVYGAVKGPRQAVDYIRGLK